MTHHHSSRYIKIILAILVIVLIVLCIFLVRQYRMAPHGRYFSGTSSAQRNYLADMAKQHSLGAADTELIQPWMTFDYVSVSFKVPVSYISTELGIPASTPGYPNITLVRYAHVAATSSAALLESVRAAVQAYLTSTPQ